MTRDRTLTARLSFFDLETTGFGAKSNQIIEIGAVKVENRQIVDTFSTFVNPERPIPFNITKLTSIDDNMVAGSPNIDVILPKFLNFAVIVLWSHIMHRLIWDL